MAAYTIENGRLERCEDPADRDEDRAGDYNATLAKLGYRVQISSVLAEPDGAEVTLYEAHEQGVPRFYVDISGAQSQIAVLVAEDFPELLAVLKEAQPLLGLFSLEQAGAIHSRTEQRAEEMRSRR